MVRDVLATPVPPLRDAGVRPDGQPVKLTATETAVLAALIAQPGRVLSRRQLLTAAGASGGWATGPPTWSLPSSGPRSGDAGTIRTVRGAGYAIDHGTNRDTDAISGAVTGSPGWPGYHQWRNSTDLRGRANRVSVLDEILDGVRADLAERQRHVSLDHLKEMARRAPSPAGRDGRAAGRGCQRDR